MDQSSLLLLSPHTFPLLPCGGSMICRALSALVSAADSMNDFAVLRVISHLFFRSDFSFSLTFLPFLKNIFPRSHIYDCESQLHAMSRGFGANWIPLCQHGIAPASSLRGQFCSSSLSTPGHSHPMQSPTCQILLSPAGSTTLCRVWTPLLYSVCHTASPFKLTFMSDQTSARKKIVETAQGSKATDWMVQEHCYFPYFTTTSFSVLRVWIV